MDSDFNIVISFGRRSVRVMMGKMIAILILSTIFGLTQKIYSEYKYDKMVRQQHVEHAEITDKALDKAKISSRKSIFEDILIWILLISTFAIVYEVSSIVVTTMIVFVSPLNFLGKKKLYERKMPISKAARSQTNPEIKP